MRSPTIAGPEYPTPNVSIDHASLGPPAGHFLSRPFSGETPSRLGPRHCGQSSARSFTTKAQRTQRANTKGVWRSSRAGFIIFVFLLCVLCVFVVRPSSLRLDVEAVQQVLVAQV